MLNPFSSVNNWSFPSRNLQSADREKGRPKATGRTTPNSLLCAAESGIPEARGQDRATVEYTITNTGKRAGKEASQVYLTLPAEAAEPSKAWADGNWVTPYGQFTVHVGGSSAETPLERPIALNFANCPS